MYSDLLFDYLKKNNTESGDDVSSLFEDSNDEITRDSYEISTDEESEKYSKPKGKYELLTIPDIVGLDSSVVNKCIESLVDILKDLMGKISNKDRVLIVGLGNRHISSDSLGAKVAHNINITINTKTFPTVMAICPSVMGLTGIETVDIVEGVILKTQPSHVILIDSLCASSVSRLGKSIQVTNTGICPGGGVGNKRKCIDSNIVSNVFSIGVPLLIYASTFISDTMQSYGVNHDLIHSIMHKIKKDSNLKEIYDVLNSVKNVINEDLDNMIVSIKDIEECVENLAYIIATAINIVLGVDEY